MVNRKLDVDSEINIFEFARFAIMQAYVHALSPKGMGPTQLYVAFI